MNRRALPVILLLTLTLGAAYALPRPKYHSENILPHISLPERTGAWRGEDVAVDINLGDKQYNFLSGVKTKKYTRPDGAVIYFTLLDAGNFHHPKVCFRGAGYEPMDLPDTITSLPSGPLTAQTLLFKKPGEDLLVMYWICLNKERVDWSRQKIKEFFYTLFNKKRTGLVIRLDIPTLQDDIPQKIAAAQDLIQNLHTTILTPQADYLWGK